MYMCTVCVNYAQAFFLATVFALALSPVKDLLLRIMARIDRFAHPHKSKLLVALYERRSKRGGSCTHTALQYPNSRSNRGGDQWNSHMGRARLQCGDHSVPAACRQTHPCLSNSCRRIRPSRRVLLLHEMFLC
jgi:hypothetical protein